jgi:hypothetical protein
MDNIVQEKMERGKDEKGEEPGEDKAVSPAKFFSALQTSLRHRRPWNQAHPPS